MDVESEQAKDVLMGKISALERENCSLKVDLRTIQRVKIAHIRQELTNLGDGHERLINELAAIKARGLEDSELDAITLYYNHDLSQTSERLSPDPFAPYELSKCSKGL